MDWKGGVVASFQGGLLAPERKMTWLCIPEARAMGFDSDPRELRYAAALAAREVAGVGGLKQARFIEQWETKLYAPAATATYNLKRLNNPGRAMQVSGERILMQCPPRLENQDLPSSTESVSRNGNSWAAIPNMMRSKAARRRGDKRRANGQA